jgi:glycosyltransferase involved in cell wall biosynthesis
VGEAAQDPVSVYLLAPTPPPNGGIASWTEAFLSVAPAFGLAVSLCEARVAVRETLVGRIKRAAHTTIVPILSMLGGRARRARVLHVCVGGGDPSWGRAILLGLIARALGKVAVVHIHGSLLEVSRGVRWLAREAARVAGVRFVTPSEEDATKERFLVHLNNFVPPPLTNAPPWTLPKATGGLRLLYVGWIIAAKGIGELIEAVAQTSGVEVDLYGPDVYPAEAAALRAAAHRMGVSSLVRFRGEIPHSSLMPAMRGYDALVLPSYGESFGMVVAEAMALGLPVVATRTGLLARAPEDVFAAVPARDSGALAQILARLRDNRQGVLAPLGVRGRQYATERFSVDPVLRAWRQIYGVPTHLVATILRAG